MNDPYPFEPPLRELLGEVASQRYSALFEAPIRVLRRRAPIRLSLSEAEQELLDVHRNELAQLLFLAAQSELARCPDARGAICGLESADELVSRTRRRRERVVAAARALGARGVDLDWARDEAPAAELLRRSIELVPDAVVQAALAVVDGIQGRPRSGLRALDQLGDPSTARARSRVDEARAFLLHTLGLQADAAGAYARAAEADPTNGSAVLFDLYFALEHGDGRALMRAAERVDGLGELGGEACDVIALQDRQLADGDWVPSSRCTERATALANESSSHLEEVLHAFTQ